jgi:hypothetical protein
LTPNRRKSATKGGSQKRSVGETQNAPAPKLPSKAYRVGRSRTGLGLFATTCIDKGAFIIEYRGRRIANAQAKRLEARGNRYMFELDNRFTLDGSSRRNVARYANHSCRPNAESDMVRGKVILRAISGYGRARRSPTTTDASTSISFYVLPGADARSVWIGEKRSNPHSAVNLKFL